MNPGEVSTLVDIGDAPIDPQSLVMLAEQLRGALVDASLQLESPGAGEARAMRDQAVHQLDDYVLPRLRDVDAPVLAVVGGSTGAGKSTLVNTLMGRVVTRAGVLRPTTRAPILVHHPSATRWFETTRILPGLARVRGGTPTGHTQIELVESTTLPADLAVIDAPDFDSVVDANRQLAAQLLDAADLWVFVTTAARYADAVPWEFLRRARQRGVAIALVLNRVPPGAAGDIAAHLTEMLGREDLGGAPVFAIDEQPLTAEGLLPDTVVGPLRSWLGALVSDQQARTEIVRRALVGTVGDLTQRVEAVAAQVDHQVAMRSWLADRADESFARAAARIGQAVANGDVMRGEVLARWHELIGTGELLHQLQSRIGRVRDRIGAALHGRATNTTQFEGAVTSGVEVLVGEEIARAVDEVVSQWRSVPAGQALVGQLQRTDLARPSADLGQRVERLVRDWQGELLETLRREGAGKRNAAKALSYGVNGVALVTMVGVFAHTGGLTGAEVAIAGGSSAVGHKLLEALLGDQAVRTIAANAREDLQTRIAALLDAEAARYHEVVDARPGNADAGGRLRWLSNALRDGVTR